MTAEQTGRLFTMRGVNNELAPFIRMTAPAEWAQQPVLEWPARQELFSSWILLFGVIPIDRHRFFFDTIDPQRGYTEASSSWTNKIWRHRRSIIKDRASYLVTDSVEFHCRLPIMTFLLAPVYRLIFKHRHQVLRSRYDSRPG